jgi:hypothetical protein
MPNLVIQAIERLRSAGVQLDPGLSNREIARVQDEYHFVFGPEHREFLQLALPAGDHWPDWRYGSADDLKFRLGWPIGGVVFDVGNGFWPASWGDQPQDRATREMLGVTHLQLVPRLVPLFSHRYLTVDPQFAPSPVFSVHQTDVIYYGDNVLDYVAHEFRVQPRHPSERTHVAFWSDLSEGAESRDL